jgi:DNA-binding CsgD family transcriptional regulator
MTEVMMGDESGYRLRLLLVVVLLAIVVGGAVDLYLDQPESWLSLHVIYEVVLIAAGLVGATALWLGWWRAERSVLALRRSLTERGAERDRWRESARAALEGLGRAIYAQFSEWSLTPTEREIALLLLKGHSHKAIAALTHRSERTVRQHSVSIYHKADLGGRAELAAFFLGDLVLPDTERGEFTAAPEITPGRSSRASRRW